MHCPHPCWLSAVLSAVMPTDTVTPHSSVRRNDGVSTFLMWLLQPKYMEPSLKGTLSGPHPSLSSSRGEVQQLHVLCSSPWSRVLPVAFRGGFLPMSPCPPLCSPLDIWEWKELFICPKLPVKSRGCLCQPVTGDHMALAAGSVRECLVHQPWTPR